MHPRGIREPIGNYYMELETLKDLYIHELKDLYSAENQIIKALPKLAKSTINVAAK
jgi:ferritin-like metal-binding protein YciE